MKFYLVAVPENPDGSEALEAAQPLLVVYGATAQAAVVRAIREAKARLSEKDSDLGSMIQFGVSPGAAGDRAAAHERAAQRAEEQRAAEAQIDRSIEGILSFIG